MALEVAQIGILEYEPATGCTTLDEHERHVMDLADDEPGDDMEPLLPRLSVDDRDRVNSSLRRSRDGKFIYDETFRVNLRDGGVR